MNRILTILFLLIPMLGSSQVDIKFSIDNQQDSVYYFCKYKGSSTFVVDTLRMQNGIIRFKQKNKLPEGIYLLTNDKNYPLIEVLIGKKQKFSLTVNDLEDLNAVVVKGCAKETELYFKLMAKVRKNNLQIKALESETEYFPENVRRIDSLRQDLEQFEESLKVKKKGAFINLVINSMKHHALHDYWEDFQFDDARILTYPLIDNKLNTYFDALADDAVTINEGIDKLIAKAGDCEEVRDYLIWYFYKKYYAPKYMNLDDVYIHLVNEYFLKLKMKNVSESVLELMANRANYLENLKIGAKFPEIGNLYSIKASYVAVVFYDKTCQKCAQEGRILEEIRTRHPEMVIFPIEVHSTNIKNLMAKYDIQTTPMIYILGRFKEIIAKRIKAEQVELILNMD